LRIAGRFLIAVYFYVEENPSRAFWYFVNESEMLSVEDTRE